MMKTKRGGFTLIELLIVIAIMGILASIILVRLQNARLKGQEASAKASARSVLTKLIDCGNDNGYAKSTDPAAGDHVCCTDGDCTDAMTGHTTVWPDLSGSGYSYTYVTGNVEDVDYSFQLTPIDSDAGKTTVACSMETSNCVGSADSE